MKIIPHEPDGSVQMPPGVEAVAPPIEEVVKAQQDARYFDIGAELPSAMAFYAFNHLSVRPYNLAEVIKLGTATKSGNISGIVDCVAATIDKPVRELLFCDFMYLCYWLRIMSYKKSPFTLKWQCEATSHQYAVIQNEAARSTLENEVVLTRSDIRVKVLDRALLEQPLSQLYDAGIVAYPQTVATVLDMEKLAKGDIDPEDNFLFPYASIISASHGQTVTDRVAFLKTLTGREDGVEMLEVLDEVSSFFKNIGVHEVLNVECKHCRVKQEVTPQVDLLSFFPLGN